MRLVVIESPFRGATPEEEATNVMYGRRALRDSLGRGEAPVALHLLYTLPGVLEDNDFGERRLGMTASQAWYRVAHACIVYADLGISDGMAEGIECAKAHGVRVEYRTIGG